MTTPALHSLLLNFITKKNNMSTAEKLEAIHKRLEFARQNPNVPFVFSVSSGYSPELTDATKDKNAAGGAYFFPPVYTVNYDKGDGTGLQKHIIIFNGEDSVTESHKFYRNVNGKFEEPGNLSMIKFEQYQMAVYGDSLRSLRMMEYFSLIEQFDGALKCKDLTKSIRSQGSAQSLKAEDVVKYSALIDQLAKVDIGYALIKSIAKNQKLNPDYNVIDGLDKMEGGKDEIVSSVKQYLIEPTKWKTFIDLFLPNREHADLVKSLMEKDAIGYNKDGKSFQMKVGGKFEKGILFTVDTDNELVQSFLFAHNLAKDNDLKVRLQNVLKGL